MERPSLASRRLPGRCRVRDPAARPGGGGAGPGPAGLAGPTAPWIARLRIRRTAWSARPPAVLPASRWTPGPGTGPSRGQERETPGPPQGRRRAGEGRQGRRARAGRPARRVPGHGGHGAGGRDRRQAPRHAGPARGARRQARRAEAVPGEAGGPDADGPVPKVLAGTGAGVAASGRRTAALVEGSEGLAESCGIRPRCRASARSRPRPRSPGRAGRAPSAAAGPPPWPASPPSPATAAPSGAGATSPAGGGVRGTSPAWRRWRPACPIPTRRRCKAGQGQGGRARKVAVTAVMRKLVVTANVLLRDRRRREDRSAPAA